MFASRVFQRSFSVSHKSQLTSTSSQLSKSLTTVLVTPGQGNFNVDSLALFNKYRDLPGVKSLLAEADESLPIDITQYIRDLSVVKEISNLGKASPLQKTSIQQPLLILTSKITNEILKELHGVDLFNLPPQSELKPDFMIGHSLGEISSLVLQDHLCFENGLKLAHKRGKLMEEIISKLTQSGSSNNVDDEAYTMMVLMFQSSIYQNLLKEMKKLSVLQDENTVGISNINNFQQIVISGKKYIISQKIEELKINLAKNHVWKGRIRPIDLNVKVPFHHPILRPIQNELSDLFDEYLDLDEELVIPVISNLNGQVTTSLKGQVANIVEVTSKPVLFVNCLEKSLSETISKDSNDKQSKIRFINFGPGNVTHGIISKFINDYKIVRKFDIHDRIENLSLDNEANIEQVSKLYK
ncbi:catalytic activity protein [[Candida] boidinii]|nr:catalytic activity protein [[Candida] boidinii]